MKLNPRIQKMTMTALVVAALSPSLAFAAGKPKPQHEHGTIKSVDMNAHTLVVAEPKHEEQTFQWNDQTKFLEHSRSTTAGALKEGERVRLTYAPGGDTPMLQSVHITPAKTETHSSSKHSSARSNPAPA